MFIYSYVNTSGNWKNKKLCGNTTPEGRSVFTQFQVFQISRNELIRVYIELCNVFSHLFKLSYVNTALNQSAFRIHKCYVLKLFVKDNTAVLVCTILHVSLFHALNIYKIIYGYIKSSYKR